MNLSDYLNESGIVPDIAGESKEAILTNLVEALAQFIPINKNNIVRLLEEREQLSTTGIGFEVAIPHCKTAEVSELQIVVARSKTGVEFEALDGKPVKLFFLLIAPEKSGSEHLKALAKIARLAKDQDIRKTLFKLDTPKKIFDYIVEMESTLG